MMKGSVFLLLCFGLVSCADDSLVVGDLSSLFNTFWTREQSLQQSNLRVAVGWNVCVDVIVRAKDLIQKRPSISLLATKKGDFVTLDGEASFAAVLKHWSSLGKAAERFVTNETFFSDLVKDALSVGRVALGGNAGLMAKHIRETATKAVLLGGIARELAKPLIPDDVSIVGPWQVKDDMVHLIVEYAKGETLFEGETPTDRANRFICSADKENAELSSAWPFFARLHSWKPDVVILAGLHMLDGLDRPAGRKLLRRFRDDLVKFRTAFPNVPVHFEWASIGRDSLAEDIVSFVAQHVDSMGFNEEELVRLLAAFKVGKGLTFSHSPSVSDVETALSELFRVGPASLSRLHFHSLGLHMIATRGSRWLYEEAAVLKGAATAGLKVCQMDRFEPVRFKLLSNLSFSTRFGKQMTFSPSASWTEDSISFFASPVLVCREPVQTVGAGDAISSSALMRSLEKVALE